MYVPTITTISAVYQLNQYEPIFKFADYITININSQIDINSKNIMPNETKDNSSKKES